jgi:hypothetical protein
VKNLTWEYPLADERGEPDAEAVLKEMNGYTVADSKQVESFQKLKDDGSTACGAWLYSGIPAVRPTIAPPVQYLRRLRVELHQMKRAVADLDEARMAGCPGHPLCGGR